MYVYIVCMLPLNNSNQRGQFFFLTLEVGGSNPGEAGFFVLFFF